MGKGTFNCVKWLLTLFNFLFIICGLSICALGVWILVSPSTINDMIGKNLAPILSYILLGTGGLILLISFCGCAGAGLENRCLLCLFFTVLCGIFVACLVGAILVSIFRKDLEELSKEKMKQNIINNYGVDKVWTDFWDQMQSRFKCCGVNDGDALNLYKRTARQRGQDGQGQQQQNPGEEKGKIPTSCCRLSNKFSNIISSSSSSSDDRDIGKTASDRNSKANVNNVKYLNQRQCEMGARSAMYTRGCANGLLHEVMQRSYIVLGALISVAVLLICGMILSLVHLRNIITNRYYHYSQPI